MISSFSTLYDAASTFVESALLPYGVVGLFLLSFFNSSVSAIPTEVLLIPLVLLDPSQALYFETVATAASVLDAGFAYWLGQYGRWAIRLVPDAQLHRAETLLQRHGIIIVGVSGISPLPFKVFCIVAGIFRLNVLHILGISLVFRGFRFFSIAVLLAIYGSTLVSSRSGSGCSRQCSVVQSLPDMHSRICI